MRLDAGDVQQGACGKLEIVETEAIRPAAPEIAAGNVPVRGDLRCRRFQRIEREIDLRERFEPAIGRSGPIQQDRALRSEVHDPAGAQGNAPGDVVRGGVQQQVAPGVGEVQRDPAGIDECVQAGAYRADGCLPAGEQVRRSAGIDAARRQILPGVQLDTVVGADQPADIDSADSRDENVVDRGIVRSGIRAQIVGDDDVAARVDPKRVADDRAGIQQHVPAGIDGHPFTGNEEQVDIFGSIEIRCAAIGRSAGDGAAARQHPCRPHGAVGVERDVLGLDPQRILRNQEDTVAKRHIAAGQHRYRTADVQFRIHPGRGAADIAIGEETGIAIREDRTGAGEREGDIAGGPRRQRSFDKQPVPRIDIEQDGGCGRGRLPPGIDIEGGGGDLGAGRTIPAIRAQADHAPCGHPFASSGPASAERGETRECQIDAASLTVCQDGNAAAGACATEPAQPAAVIVAEPGRAAVAAQPACLDCQTAESNDLRPVLGNQIDRPAGSITAVPTVRCGAEHTPIATIPAGTGNPEAADNVAGSRLYQQARPVAGAQRSGAAEGVAAIAAAP